MITPPTDPLFRYQWFLSNTGQSGGGPGSDINVLSVWPDYTGRGVRVAIVDDGVQLDHPDLKANIDIAASWDAARNVPGGDPFGNQNHGTAVAGLVGEVANNGIGGSGVAPDATLLAYRISFGKGNQGSDIAFQKALQNNADVVNNSWGADAALASNANDPAEASLFAAFAALATQGRGGKGSIVLFANGNAGASGADGNLDNLLNSRYTIAVGAMDDANTRTAYSTPGANLLIAAPAGASLLDQSDERPGNGVLTTDRTGSDGYNTLAGPAGDYAFNFNGTSAAAPVATGVVALVLQANPNLGYRDVQEILAHSARFIDSGSTSWTRTHPGSSPWNGGSELFSRSYGFGEIDAHGAVRLAEVYPYLHSAPRSDANVLQRTASVPVNVMIDSDPEPSESDDLPDLASNTVFGVSLPAGVDLNHLDLTLFDSVEHPSNLTVTLTSPSGTTIAMIDNPANAGDPWPAGGFSMGTNAFWGEQSGGTWLVNVSISGEKEVGTVQSATLTGYGDAASTEKEFVYTDSLAAAINLDNWQLGSTPRTTLKVAAGETAVIDAAAVSGAVSVNLSPWCCRR